MQRVGALHQMKRLENETDLTGPDRRALLFILVGEIFAEQDDFAAAGLIETGHQAQQGGLAGTGGTLDNQRFPILNIESYII